MASLCRERSPDTAWSWVVCFSATYCTALHFGFSQSFGIFLPELSSYFNENKESTAWAGSIAIAFTLFAGPIASKLIQTFSHRPVCIVASAICSLSLLCSSFVDNLRLLYFIYGVAFGLGSGTMLNAGYTITYAHFNKKRSLASGITASGATIGVMSLGPILEELVNALGWRGALRVTSGIMVSMCFLSCTFVPVRKEVDVQEPLEVQREDNASKKKCATLITYLSVFRTLPYSIGALTIVIGYLGMFVPNIHLVKFANDLNISSKEASYLFIAMGVCSTIARVLSGIIFDRKWIRPLQGIQIAILSIGVLFMLIALAKKLFHLALFSCGFGFSNGIFVTSQVLFFQSILDPSKSSIGLGMGYFVSSLGVCVGAPLAGYIADKTGSYILAFRVLGGVLLAASFLPFVLKIKYFRESQKRGKNGVEVIVL